MNERRARPPEKWSFTMPMLREATIPSYRTQTPADVARLCQDMQHAAQEAFVVIDVNCKNNVIDKRLVSLGLADASLVHPREVFRGAIANNAAAVILVHNHPSGDPTPSAEDVRITRQLVQAGDILSIRVLDHIIIGHADETRTEDRASLSLRESGCVSFTH